LVEILKHMEDCNWELLSILVDIAESEGGEKDRLSIDTHESVNQLSLTSEVMKVSFRTCCEGDPKG
jgi:hypothetical protein